MPTTQNVSHPPVKPKYGVFAPARPLLDTAMAQRAVTVVSLKDEQGKMDVNEEGKKERKKRRQGGTR